MENQVVAVSEMKSEDLELLPKVDVRVSRTTIVDRKTNKVSGVRFVAEPLINSMVTPRLTISQAQFGLILVATDKPASNGVTVKAYANYSKGFRKNGRPYYFAEFYISKDVVLRCFFSDDEVKLLNALVKKGVLKINFKERPETELPGIDDARDDELVI